MSADVRLAKAIIAALTAERDRLQYRLDHAQVERDQALAERDTLAAQLARVAVVIDKAVAVLRVTGSDWADSPIELLRTAVDAYRATPATTEREGAGDE